MECTILRPSEKQFSGGGGFVANPRTSTAFSLSRVGINENLYEGLSPRRPLTMVKKSDEIS